MLEAVLTGAVRGGTSILYATLGETVSERAGVINLGTEGSMLAGALGGYATTASTGNIWLGVAVGMACGLALALLHGFVVLYRSGNQLATGLAVTFLGTGLTALFGDEYVSRGIHGFKPVALPGLSRIPLLGSVLFDHDPLTYLGLLAAPALWWLLFHTSAGLAIRAAGEDEAVLVAQGKSARRTRLLATAGGGALAGLGGAQLSTAYTLTWSQGMTVGRGFVAVALVIFAAWHPIKAIGGAWFFAGAVALQLQLQARGTEISPFLLNAVPYLATIAVLTVWGRHRMAAAPDGLQRVFEATPTR